MAIVNRRCLGITILLALASQAIFACPFELQRLRSAQLGNLSFCQIYDLHQKAIESLKLQGVRAPERLADYMAPQFINGSTWERKRFKYEFNPLMIYEPAPATWQSWEQGYRLAEQQAHQNRINRKIAPISLEWLLLLHLTMMTDLSPTAGKLRVGGEIGLALETPNAISPEQAKNLLTGGGIVNAHDPSMPLYTWNPTICFNQQDSLTLDLIRDRKQRKEFWFSILEWRSIPESQFFKDEDGQPRQCGYISYPEAYEIKQNLATWLAETNSQTQTWWSDQPPALDPILALSRAHRHLIGIHPFVDGNGRVSRSIIGLLIKSLGLPAPVYTEMDDDIYVSESEWAGQIGKGIVRSLFIIQRCAKDSTSAGCNLIPLSQAKE
jgi:hypothetical protein